MGSGGDMKRVRIVFRGIVQGVGFRPTVYRCAVACGLAGFVQNRRSEVVVEVQGAEQALERFETLLGASLPGPARIDSESREEMRPEEEVARGLSAREPAARFEIRESASSQYVFPPIPPDLALCSECRRELLDRANRRYLYPFITCTECGPRYSIVERTPFDRETTSMVDFPQCDDCLGEYTDPADRRFHSQTNSCAKCGPSLRLVGSDGRRVQGDPLREVIAALADGKVVAVQGIGGFHLAADPTSEKAMRRLRAEKQRARKPFALMACEVEEARLLCELTDSDREVLTGTVSPIVIMPARASGPQHLRRVSDTGTLGIMLPYTPLHYLLFFHPEVDVPYRHLVMTSGNKADEPIITDPRRALKELGSVADLFLSNDRRILFATDDSLVRLPVQAVSSPPALRQDGGAQAASPIPGDGPCLLRRSRGYVPRILRLKEPLPVATLAAGSDLKSAPALGKEDMVYLAPYGGDLDEPATRSAFQRAIERMIALYETTPERIVYDLHPQYFSSMWAASSSIPERLAVQHHYAHILSVMAEHGLDESLGVAFDGTGYGTDGTIWGGEFLQATRHDFVRLGSFRPFALPGGDEAIRHPLRIAFSILRPDAHDSQRSDRVGTRLRLTGREETLLAQMIDRSVNAPLTSSSGRLFDAAAALLGIVREVSYEGEGPMKLEALARTAYNGAVADNSWLAELLPLRGPTDSEGHFSFDPRPLLAHVASAPADETPAGEALLFHRAMAEAIVRGVVRMREQTGLVVVSLSGGVFQNMLLRELLLPRLREEGLRVYLNESVPAGDGGIAVGQMWYAPFAE